MKKEEYKKPVLKKIGNVSIITAGTGSVDFDNGSNARAGKTVS